MKSIVKISHGRDTPELKLATEEGYERILLERGKDLKLEISNSRRCVGFHSDRGEMTPCPEFREIESGDQCIECRNRDIYTGWRKGEGTPGFEADYSVYLAQCGKKVKVGVTRTGRLETRWKEQGADYGVELLSEITDEKALEKEKEISEKGVTERIRKENKIGENSSFLIKKKLEELGYQDKEIRKVSKPVKAKELVRKGIFPSPIKTVKGQIISNGRIAMAMSSGKVIEEQRQRGLNNF